jgi:protein arginine kinase activator
MLCDICKKRNASLHYTKIINGKIEEKHLCEICAFENQDFDIYKPFSIHKLFSGLFDNSKIDEDTEVDDITCSNCGLTLSTFQKTGKLGCAKCYDEFSQYIKPIINGIHGHYHHRGKAPNRIGPDILLEKEVDELSMKLEEAVKAEEFEQAAVLRDEIKRMKEKLQMNRE